MRIIKYNFIFVFASIISILVSILFSPSKNKSPVLGCFESRALAYRTFKKTMYIPQLYLPFIVLYKFPAGEWEIQPGMNLFQMLRMFNAQKPIDTTRKITIIEGMCAKQIEQMINESTLLDGPAVKLCEAQLFPDTYHFKYRCTRARIVEIASANMQNKINTLWEKRPSNFALTKNEWIILASIVQKEGKYRDDMPKNCRLFFVASEKEDAFAKRCVCIVRAWRDESYKSVSQGIGYKNRIQHISIRSFASWPNLLPRLGRAGSSFVC